MQPWWKAVFEIIFIYKNILKSLKDSKFEFF